MPSPKPFSIHRSSICQGGDTEMDDSGTWYKTFFSDLWLDVQRHSKTEAQTNAEADFIEDSLKTGRRSKLLDVPCGTGRHSVELARRGHCVTGVDLALSSLREARREASERHQEVRWVHADMRELPWNAEFDGALCLWGSFGYFDDRGNLRFLEALLRALRPGGRFLLDTHVAETLLPRLSQERSWKRVGDTLVLEEPRYDPSSARTHTEWTLIREGRTFTNSTSIRLYTYRELVQLLEGVGFVDFVSFGSLNGDPFELNSPRLYLIATRP